MPDSFDRYWVFFFLSLPHRVVLLLFFFGFLSLFLFFCFFFTWRWLGPPPPPEGFSCGATAGIPSPVPRGALLLATAVVSSAPSPPLPPPPHHPHHPHLVSPSHLTESFSFFRSLQCLDENVSRLDVPMKSIHWDSDWHKNKRVLATQEPSRLNGRLPGFLQRLVTGFFSLG